MNKLLALVGLMLAGPVAAQSALSVADIAVAENSGAMTFTISASPAPVMATGVDFSVNAGTASVGSDFVAVAGHVDFAIGQTEAQVVVTVLNESLVEADESLLLTLSNPAAGATLADAQGIGSINNDDSATLSIDNLEVDEGESGATLVNLIVSTSAPVQGGFSVTVTSADGNDANPLNNATAADADYTPITSQANFASGSTAPALLALDVLGDTQVEPDQGLRILFANPLLPPGVDPADLDLSAVGAVLIRNDDGAVLRVDDVLVSEGAGDLMFQVSLSDQSKSDISVNYQVSAGSATAGADFTAVNGTLVIPALSSSAPINVPLVSDNIVEPTETVTVQLSMPIGAFIGDGQATGSIDNDDSATVDIADASRLEGAAGVANLSLNLVLSNPVAGLVTVQADSADGNDADASLNALLADNDYLAQSASVNFPALNTAQMFSVPINGDLRVEADQSLRVLLSNLQVAAGIPIGAVTLGDSSALATIINDDFASLSMADNSVIEGTGANSNLVFTLTSTLGAESPIEVDYTLLAGSAGPGDYSASSGTLRILPPDLTTSLSVAVTGDSIVESAETFSIALSNPRLATLADAEAIGTITDDDSASLSVADVAALEGSTMLFTLNLSQPVQEPLRVDYTTQSQTAIAGLDFVDSSGSLIIPSLATTATISVPLLVDSELEPDETLLLNLTATSPGPPQVLISDAQAIGTVFGADPQVPVPLDRAWMFGLVLAMWLVVRRRLVM